MGATVIVSGATGNIGTSLLPALTARGHRVVGLARRIPVDDTSGVRWLSSDLSTASGRRTLREVLSGADAYVHLAWPLQPMRRPHYLHRAGPETMLACVTAALDAGVERVVHVSSVAAYRPASHTVRVEESWTLGGVQSSTYAQHKAEGETRLARELHRRDAADRVAVMRPCLVGKRTAGAIMMRSGAPVLLPGGAVGHLPVSPVDRDFALQMVHADDVASAIVAAIERGAHGAFNLAGDGSVTGPDVAESLGTRINPLPMSVGRRLAALAWHARLLPLDPGWIDMALQCPFMDTRRAKRDLGWAPQHTAVDVLDELVAGMTDGIGDDTAVLRRRTVVDGLLTDLRRGPISRRRHG